MILVLGLPPQCLRRGSLWPACKQYATFENKTRSDRELPTVRVESISRVLSPWTILPNPDTLLLSSPFLFSRRTSTVAATAASRKKLHDDVAPNPRTIQASIPAGLTNRPSPRRLFNKSRRKRTVRLQRRDGAKVLDEIHEPPTNKNQRRE